jgi:hypothetical protein
MDIETKALYNRSFVLQHKIYKFIKEKTEDDTWLVLKSSTDTLQLNKLTNNIEKSYTDAVERVVLLGARLLGV